MVQDTCANNLVKIFADLADDSILKELRPDGTELRIRAADRVWSLTVVDQSNGAFEFTTVDQMVEMLSDACLFSHFTEAGKFLEDRNRDHEDLGTTGRASSQER